MSVSEVPKKKRKRSPKSLRREIRERLALIDDTDVLRMILKIVRDNEPKMPEELVKKLKASDRAVAEGRVHSHEDVMKWAEQWLSEH